MVEFKNPAKFLFYGIIEAIYIIKKFRHKTSIITIEGELPSRPYLCWKIFRLAGLEPTRNKTALCYAHFDQTECSPTVGLNGMCTDIRKSKVEEIFEKVFGYPLSVDPEKFSGTLVRKSEINAAHDGAVLQGPLAREAGYVYERLIDATDEAGNWTDYRPCVIGTEIPFVYIKQRRPENMFANTGNRVRAVQASEVFAESEIQLLIKFAREMKLDLGEMDVLKDKASGKLFVVDVAKTPHSPSDSFINYSGLKCMLAAARSFRRQFLSR